MTSDNKEQDSIGNNTLLLRFVVPSPYDWQNAIIITTDKKLHKVSVDKNKMYAIKTCSFRLLLNPALVLLTHKSCVMTKKGFEGIKPVAGSYLGLLPTVCILSGHRTIIRPISWPATFPTSKDISPRSHCWVSWAYQTDFCIWHLAQKLIFTRNQIHPETWQYCWHNWDAPCDPQLSFFQEKVHLTEI